MAAADVLTYPQQASACRKGGYILIKDHPCKIFEMSTSKTGQHGHAKCSFTGVDIFDGSKHQLNETSTHNVHIPNVSREEYLCNSIDEDGDLDLMDANANFSNLKVKSNP